MKISLPTFFLFALAGMYLLSCRPDENFITDSNAKLEFSVDTLRFDTVFTELGSATRFFKIYNRNDQPIKISNINVEGTNGAFFRINVDGIPGNSQTEVEVRAEDSIYLFAEVTVDPDAPLSESPFVIEDYVVFETNGNQQKVLLEAWGQNAIYIPNQFSSGEIWSPCTSPDVTWDDEKPYVIYGIMVVDDCVLNIEEGTVIYMHGGITRNDDVGIFNEGIIFVTERGRLKINGTLENPVIFEDDRLEDEFDTRAGQWAGIILSDGSFGNQINYTEFRNGSLGIVVDSAAFLTINNSKIFNTSSVGLVGIHSTIVGNNLLLHSNGGNALQLIYGGRYEFNHLTAASYGVDASALSMSNGICLDDFCEEVAGNDLDVKFTNSIIMGSRRDEIALSSFSDRTGARLDYNFENCIVRVEELLDETRGGFPDFFNFCQPCTNADTDDALFRNTDEDDYHLDTLSIAENQAILIPTLPNDLDGVERGNSPDIGCFEFVPR